MTATKNRIRKPKAESRKPTAPSNGNGHAGDEPLPAPGPVLPPRAPVAEAAQLLRVENIFPHPHNRAVRMEDCADLAESLKREGLLEPIRVRPHPLTAKRGHYQIIIGERRWRAAMIAGWEEIAAIVCEEGDLDTLRLMAAENAQRQDLNPIEKAQHLAKLCQAGLTREAAGKIFGLSTSAASNLVRLLELPKSWKDRVIAGELPESFARLVLPYKAAPKLLAEIERCYKQEIKWRQDGSLRRGEFERIVNSAPRHVSRTMDRKGGEEYCWELGGRVGRLFDADPDLEKQLEVVEVALEDDAGKKTVERRALNVKLWAKLQEKAIEKVKAKQAKKKGAKATAASGAAAKVSPEELRRQAKERAEKFRRRVKEWRHAWIRRELAKRVEHDDWQCAKIVAFALAALEHMYPGPSLRTLVREAIGEGGGKPMGLHDRGGAIWRALSTLPMTWSQGPANSKGGEKPTNQALANLFHQVAQEILWPSRKDTQPCNLDYEVIDGLAADYELDLKACWAELWKSDTGQKLIESFLELHSKEQLERLASDDWKTFFEGQEGAKKSSMIKALMSNPRPLPSAIAGGKAKAKRKAKSR
jgi:ParB family chromosome partitioning protein